ncbi:hypothetical protein VHUM_00688 [Vanrija humicola]|uniref:Glycosyltransferase family 18 catalytic domain-containing protein n=1 Tax=Vanrija humicola TaxID=5417 RepID=A0A7D8V8K6_VANHU|nr:hypothetical protein VHUM_00688 [Vanrija humicola]
MTPLISQEGAACWPRRRPGARHLLGRVHAALCAGVRRRQEQPRARRVGRVTAAGRRGQQHRATAARRRRPRARLCAHNRAQDGAHGALPCRVGGAPRHQLTPSEWEKYRSHNYRALDRLAECVLHGGCNDSEETVVLAGSFHFGGTRHPAPRSPTSRAASTIEMFETLNHTILYAWNHWEALLIYQALSTRIPIVILERDQYEHCVKVTAGTDDEGEGDAHQHWRKLPYCIQSEKYPLGIPYWKVFLWHFWEGSDHALGGRWVMGPEDYSKIYRDDPKAPTHYLGYSIESRCRKQQHFAERKHRGLAFGKSDDYFNKDQNVFWEVMAKVRDMIRPDGQYEFDILALSGDELGEGVRKETQTPNIWTLGHQTRAGFERFLGQSKVMIGIGPPKLSPSPYDALCMGVPFINPILEWDKKQPANKAKWKVQQGALIDVPEPYVYHVYKGDEEGLHRAVQAAVDTPIQRYIPPAMRFDAVLARHRDWVANDWHAEAKAYVAKKYKGRPETDYAHLVMDEAYMVDFPGPRIGEWIWKEGEKR